MSVMVITKPIANIQGMFLRQGQDTGTIKEPALWLRTTWWHMVLGLESRLSHLAASCTCKLLNLTKPLIFFIYKLSIVSPSL